MRLGAASYILKRLEVGNDALELICFVARSTFWRKRNDCGSESKTAINNNGTVRNERHESGIKNEGGAQTAMRGPFRTHPR